jgi:hypothetical protein
MTEPAEVNRFEIALVLDLRMTEPAEVNKFEILI